MRADFTETTIRAAQDRHDFWLTSDSGTTETGQLSLHRDLRDDIKSKVVDDYVRLYPGLQQKISSAITQYIPSCRPATNPDFLALVGLQAAGYVHNYGRHSAVIHGTGR
jgi:hypothetical protein